MGMKTEADDGGYRRFHQLHCLASMRKALQDAREGVDIGVDYRDNGHWPHCFDYLRKVISLSFFFPSDYP